MEQVIDRPERIKTGLGSRDLGYFRELLIKKRDEAEDEMEVLRNLLGNMIDSDDADNSSNAHHMADVASEEEAIQRYYSLISRTRNYISQLNKALERIEAGTYGICRATGKPIPKGRLEAVPHTQYSVDAKLKGLDKN